MKVSVPERFGRRMSIGPFEDPRDFLRFAFFACLAGLATIIIGPWAGLLVISSGAFLVLVRIREETLLAHLLRRGAFMLFRRGGIPPTGQLFNAAWKDPSGRLWNFYLREPYPIYGRAPEELHAVALRLTRLLATAPLQEALFCRLARRWDPRALFPSDGPSGSPPITAYRRLIESSVRGKHRATLMLGIPSNTPHDRLIEENLFLEGWKRAEGRDLRESIRWITSAG